jgi:hypothetical protein
MQPCKYCKALLFPAELKRPSICCLNGRVVGAQRDGTQRDFAGKVKLPEIQFLPQVTTIPTDVEFSNGYPDLTDRHDPISTIIKLTGYKRKYLILRINEISERFLENRSVQEALIWLFLDPSLDLDQYSQLSNEHALLCETFTFIRNLSLHHPVQLNAALALSSISGKHPPVDQANPYNPTVIYQGKIHNITGSLFPSPNRSENDPVYPLQMLFIEPEDRTFATLTHFFQYNQKMLNMSEDERREFDPNWPKPYPEFPSSHGWAPRKIKPPHGFVPIGRLPVISPANKELFALRLLLFHDTCQGATSFDRPI